MDEERGRETAVLGRWSGRALLATTFAFVAIGAFGIFGAPAFSSDDPTSAAYEYNNKVTICHHTGSTKNPTVTIVVSIHALDAHLKHGDTVGPCP